MRILDILPTVIESKGSSKTVSVVFALLHKPRELTHFLLRDTTVKEYFLNIPKSFSFIIHIGRSRSLLFNHLCDKHFKVKFV